MGKVVKGKEKNKKNVFKDVQSLTRVTLLKNDEHVGIIIRKESCRFST